MKWGNTYGIPAARTISSFTRIAPDITTPKPKPGKMYALFAWCFYKWKCVKNLTWIEIYTHTQISNLGRYEKLLVVFDWIKWASTPKYCTTLHIIRLGVLFGYAFQGDIAITKTVISQKWHKIIISRIQPDSMNKPAQQYIQISMLGWIARVWLVSAFYWKDLSVILITKAVLFWELLMSMMLVLPC